jgi:hypothetical protein
LTYARKISTDRYLWGKVFYAPERPLILNNSQIGAKDVATIHELNRTQALFGVDQIFHPTGNPFWGFIAGAGVGLAKSEYRSTYYRGICAGYICVYDPSSGSTKHEVDSYGFVSGQVGVGVLDTQIWSLKGNLRILISQILSRTGQFSFTSPSGQEFDTLEGKRKTLLTVETSVIF